MGTRGVGHSGLRARGSDVPAERSEKEEGAGCLGVGGGGGIWVRICPRRAFTVQLAGEGRTDN
jgi:hypothetical protein